MVFVVLFAGIGLGAACFLCGFFGVAGSKASAGREAICFTVPIFSAAFLGWCGSLLDNEELTASLLCCSAAYAAGLALLATALPRLLYRFVRGERYGIILLFRFSSYCAVVAALASNTDTLILQITIAALLFCVLFYIILALTYYGFRNSKSSLSVLIFPVNYIVTVSVMVSILGIKGTFESLATMHWLQHLIFSVFPLGFLFILACSKGSEWLFAREREKWLIEKLQKEQQEKVRLEVEPSRRRT